MQLELSDEYHIFIYVCRCGRPVLKALTYERDGEKCYTCPCSPGKEWYLDSAELEKMNGGGAP